MIIVMTFITIFSIGCTQKIDSDNEPMLDSVTEDVTNNQMTTAQEILEAEEAKENKEWSLFEQTEEVYLKTTGESMHDDGSYHRKHEFTYNEYGELLEETVYDYDTLEMCYSIIYEYDNHGNKTKEEHRNSDGYPSLCYQYEYSEDKLIKEIWLYYEDNEVTNEYITEYEYGEEYVKKLFNNGHWAHVYYNDLQQIIKYEGYMDTGEIIANIEYTYDEYGNEVKSVDYGSGNFDPFICTKEYIYDEEGRLSAVYPSQNGEENTEHTSYGYDEYGNQTYVENWEYGSYEWTMYEYELCTVKVR